MNAPLTPDCSNAALDRTLRELHRELLDDALPPSLHAAALRLETAHQQAAQGRRGASLAAGVLLAFGMGWLAHGQLAGAAYGASGTTGAAQEFVRQAGFAYSVYQPEKRHPVEVAAAEQEHLVQWLSKRLGRPLKVPHLEAQGFTLVGGRLLPGEAGARAQFMFQNPQAQRITLYLGALDKASPNPQLAQVHQDPQATQFRFDADAPVPSFYWAEQGFGYALSGPVDHGTLMALASSVYAQLNRD